MSLVVFVLSFSISIILPRRGRAVINQHATIVEKQTDNRVFNYPKRFLDVVTKTASIPSAPIFMLSRPFAVIFHNLEAREDELIVL